MNWKVRIKNKAFWITFIPTALLTVQAMLAVFGIEWDSSLLSEQLLAIVNPLFACLALVGVVIDPTTKGVKDSEQALSYDKPKE